MERTLCILIGYVCGLFQTGYFYGKMKKIDVREHGSGNAGATNTLRTLGLKAGLCTFLGDSLKTVAAVAIVKLLFKNNDVVDIIVLGAYAGMGAVLGHNFPFYLNFKGGKGIASTAGLIVSMSWLTNNWILTLLGFLTFVIPVAITRYVSLGSLLLIAGFLLEVIIFGQGGKFGMSQLSLIELWLIIGTLTVLAFMKHRANIIRLCNGTENKLGKK
ncbi:glycerol-3-phosphate 1-O-acyltransferase PlsY [Anaerosacchariphilus polymeriproducens]|uniref:Glycerol-3-phosphate acyltransferase n=1 Tax=Anaerosacchariphilus polymeriproducens TaxID=1812858 RepID=A0A371AUB7_9FIRM|nr:glycerol-3-phosphate 1-O-acyltransferase PlsY [Anaerosacchariphilus polymeriproducens]RDU23157.1 glycerol-3-phosphate 1-O-acyltransferase [Anaerosacchariphilus polymeriproducens]